MYYHQSKESIIYLIRASELVQKSHEECNHKYIEEHIDEFEKQVASRAFRNNPDYLQKVKELITNIAVKNNRNNTHENDNIYAD